MKHNFLPKGIIFLILLLFGSILLYPNAHRKDDSVHTLTEWTMDTDREKNTPITFPLTLNGLDPRTPVTFTASVSPKTGSYIYLKTVYSPVRVYADEELIFSYGQDGTYPAFLLDPPTKVELLPLPQSREPLTLKMEFLSPTQRSSMTVYPVLLGTSDAILEQLFSNMGFSLLFSIVLVALGILLSLTAIVLAQFDKAGTTLHLLGAFSFLVGIWIFGECNLTGLFIDNPSFLYLTAFLGLFTLSIPLLKFGNVIFTSSACKKLLRLMYTILELSVCTAVLLQLMGIMSLSRIMYLFHLLIPLALCIFAGCVLWETFHHKDPFISQFLFPVFLLAVFSILEVVNYYLLRHLVQISFFFQIGMLLFICSLCILCGNFTLHSFRTQARNRQLSYELSLMEKQIRAQKEQYAILSETDASIKAQRHDLKHQLAVIRNYNENGQSKELADYLDSLIARIPVSKEKRLCENNVVNTVALYYLTMAEKSGISLSPIQLDIPSDTGQVQETDLCVLIGNLLENAVAACQGPCQEPPFIRIQSRLQYGILTITMDNYCLCAVQMPNGLFQSEKPGGGTGLASIRSIARRYGGDARFEWKEHTFLSSVYLRMFDDPPLFMPFVSSHSVISSGKSLPPE